MILAKLPPYGSIDVSVVSESECGMKSSAVKMVLCDQNVHKSPIIEKSPDYGGPGQSLDFFW